MATDADDHSTYDLLAQGQLEHLQRVTAASNLTVLAHCRDADRAVRCVYKPIAGERPLWDFPDGTLAGREVAADVISRALRWDVVPPTVLRPDGPFGPGMCQLWVDEDASVAGAVALSAPADVPAGYLPIVRGHDEGGSVVVLSHADRPDLRRMALFDVIVNNGDRKGSHILAPVSTTGVQGVDHGVCFHWEDKLRTVLWGWAGQSITATERLGLQQLAATWSSVVAELSPLITAAEIEATQDRLDGLLDSGRFPEPEPGWPRLPWPAL